MALSAVTEAARAGGFAAVKDEARQLSGELNRITDRLNENLALFKT